MNFDGFLALYQEGQDEDPEDEESRRLPQMSAGERLAKREINCNVSYRWPIHIMRGSADLGYHQGQFPVAERKAQRIFSLPMYPHLKDEEVDTVIDALKEVV